MTRTEWGKQFDRCFLCGAKACSVWPPILETHEIARGVDRDLAIKEPACWIRCCQPCHTQRLDSMPIATQLALKKHCDPENYDRVAVNRIRTRHYHNGPVDDAITEGEVIMALYEMEGAIESLGYPFQRIKP
jgi:hypothetical protein